MVEIPILPETEVLRGDILTIAGSTRHVDAAVEALGVRRSSARGHGPDDRRAAASSLGGLVGALSVNWGGIPIGLSTSGGALLAGLVLGYLRAVRPTFGRIPTPALSLMNTLGLNVFIAIVGINAGPGFVAGLQQVGLSLFLWGIVATSVPLVVAILLGHYVFKFHPAILFGVCAGVRTTTAALGMIQDAAKSKVPALGYGMPYAIGNTLLTIFGMAVVLLDEQVRLGSERQETTMDAVTLRQYETLSPFEIKNDLAKVAAKTAKASQVAYLNAGRGNPNWIATEPRSAFFLLGQFAITESQRTMQPACRRRRNAEGAGHRRAACRLARRRTPTCPAPRSCENVVPWAVKTFDFNADAFVHELVDSIIGDNYPVPDRMLVHNERIVREYLQWAMCGEPRPAGTFDLYAVEGGTAAMCYLFKSLKANRLLNPGDTIAMVTPIFTPYLEMPHLEDYDLQDRSSSRRGRSSAGSSPTRIWRRCSIPKVKAFFVVNPGQPLRGGPQPRVDRGDRPRPREASRSHAADRRRLRDVRAGLPIAARRVSAGTRSASTPTASTSAARAGASASSRCTRTTSSTRRSPRIPSRVAQALDKRYAPLTLEPRTIKFIDRIVADSRDIALNHTAGLSLPQQVMMTLFSLAELHDEKKVYQQACIDILRKRVLATIEGLGHRGSAQPAVRLVLRPHRLRVLAAQVRRRGRRHVGEGERPPARHRVPPRRGPRHRAAQRRRLRRAGLVGARLVREPRRRRLRRHRPRRPRGRAQLRHGLPGLAGGGRVRRDGSVDAGMSAVAHRRASRTIPRSRSSSSSGSATCSAS